MDYWTFDNSDSLCGFGCNECFDYSNNIMIVARQVNCSKSKFKSEDNNLEFTLERFSKIFFPQTIEKDKKYAFF